MRLDEMRGFLSEDTINLHLGQYMKERCKCSIFEKSIPEVKGKTIRDIIEMPMRGALKEELLECFIAAKSHELYFSSFCTRRKACSEIKKYYSSEAAFLFECSEKAKRLDSGFLYVIKDRGGAPRAVAEDELRFGRGFSPCLALDMSEHAYFLDYRFAKERYIAAALAHLDLSEIFSGENCKLYLDTPI